MVARSGSASWAAAGTLLALATVCLVVPGPGAAVSFAVAGVVCLASGVWVLASRPWRPDRGPSGSSDTGGTPRGTAHGAGATGRWRGWLGLLLLDGALSVLSGAVGLATGSAVARLISSGLGLVGLACLIGAVVAMVRSGAGRHLTVRLGLDCVVGAASVTFLIWVVVLGPVTGYAFQPAVVQALVVIGGFLTLFVAISLVAVRQLNRAAGSGVLGLGLGAIGAVVAEHSFIGAGGATGMAWAAACWTFTFPLLAKAIRDYHPTPRSGSAFSDADLRDTRIAAVVAQLSIAGVGVAVGMLWLRRDEAVADARMPIAFVTLIILGFCIHEGTYAVFRYRLTRRLLQLAFQDPLTGLANRRALSAAIADLPPGAVWSVVDLDLDGFKQLNEVLGHEVGDDVLLGVAEELGRLRPEGATVARIGGDEFALLVPLDLAEAEALADRLLARLRELLGRLGGGLPLSVSLGVGRVGRVCDVDGDIDGAVDGSRRGSGQGGAGAVADHDRDDERGAERLSALADAAAALHAAQTSGRNRVAVYAGDVATARDRGTQVERCLPAAIQRHEITAHGQVVVELRSGRITGVEALARWTSPVLGPVRPDEFIPVAERGSALIGAMGSQILRFSVAQAVDRGLVAAGLRIAVNVSPVQLRNPQFVPVVRAVVEEFAIPAPQLVLEVTEQVLMDDDASAIALVQLKDLGVRIAIDDFGAGYSALSYLRRIPMDVLKIDRQWTVDALHDRRTRDVVATVNDLAHRLGAVVVMEGIENEEVAAMCRDVGADHAQGWHFGRPEPFDALAPKVLQHNASLVA